jgi:hypothetical protein
MRRARGLVILLYVLGCGDDSTPDKAPIVTKAGRVLTTAPAAGEYVATFRAQTMRATDWGQPGNEAMVLELTSNGNLITHVVLHEGAIPFMYAIPVGQLSLGEAVSVRVSELSAGGDMGSVTVDQVTLAAPTGDDLEALANSPIYKWPVEKSFDDLPIVVGWSRTLKRYETFFTNENGGTTADCPPKPLGIATLFKRYGRGYDIETDYSYATNPPVWGRCAPSYIPPTPTPVPRMEGMHPKLYYGDGHNHVFEDRSGYGVKCGFLPPELADGLLLGWNVGNPGNAESQDGPFTITIRLLPVDLDAIGYADTVCPGGCFERRERAIDVNAPWLYGLTNAELLREGKIDNTVSFPVEDYVFLDVLAQGVDGMGDGVCDQPTMGGFTLAAAGVASAVPVRMTAAYFGGSNTQSKRMSVLLGPGAADPTAFDITAAADSAGLFLRTVGPVLRIMPAAAGTTSSVRYLQMNVSTQNLFIGPGCMVGSTKSPSGSSETFMCVGMSAHINVM